MRVVFAVIEKVIDFKDEKAFNEYLAKLKLKGTWFYVKSKGSLDGDDVHHNNYSATIIFKYKNYETGY